MKVQVLGGALMLALAVSVGAGGAAAAEPSPALPEGKWRAWQTGALRPDRLQHASLSAAAALGIGLASESPGAGVALSLALGVGKEIIDVSTSRFDWGDLAADALGAALGGLAAAALLE